jgi:hypothetical protein
MGLKFTAVEADFDALGRELSGDALNQALANYAREQLGEAIGSGAASEHYRTFVNGQEGASERAVQFPGPILYEFIYWREIADYALAFLRARSPVDSGDYRDAHHLRNAALQKIDLQDLAADTTTLVVTNDVPYARKIEVGGMRLSVPPYVYEDAASAVRRQYGEIVKVDVRYLELPGGYVLKGRQRSTAKTYAARIQAGGANVRGRSYVTARKDSKAGQKLTYPALVIEAL